MSLHPSRLVCARSTFKWNFRHKSQTPRNPFFLCPPFRAALLLLAKAVQTFGPNYLKFYAPFPYLFFPFFLPHGRTLWRIRVGSFGRILKSQHCYDFETNWGRKHIFFLALNLMAGARKIRGWKKRAWIKLLSVCVLKSALDCSNPLCIPF